MLYEIGNQIICQCPVQFFIYVKMLLVATAALADFCQIIYNMLVCLIFFAFLNDPVCWYLPTECIVLLMLISLYVTCTETAVMP